MHRWVDAEGVSILPSVNSCLITVLAILRFLQWHRAKDRDELECRPPVGNGWKRHARKMSASD